VVGCLVHHSRHTHALIDVNQYPHDVNLTLSCLLFALLEESIDGRLTPVLHIQLDNTARENKNKYFLAFAAYLVQQDFVKEITLNFLMVGHTHEGQ